ncbi:MAG: energy-coupling factor transporter transmembrane component T [Oscillospiraceae bacterium]
MLKDITFGQYVFRKSSIHKLDPRFKLIVTVVYIVLLFVFSTLECATFAFLFMVCMYFAAKIPIKMLLRSLKPILPIVIFTAVLNTFFVGGRDVLVEFWIIKITAQGLYFAVLLSLRIIALLAASSLLTYTTSPIELTDAIERLLSPFSKIGVPVHELAMMMTIALRFIPTLIEETDRIMSAQKSRGANIDTGKFVSRVKALIPILVPLFISAFRRADELALAMECRCYHGGEGRTRLKQLKFKTIDIFGIVVFLIFGTAMFFLSKFSLQVM